VSAVEPLPDELPLRAAVGELARRGLPYGLLAPAADGSPRVVTDVGIRHAVLRGVPAGAPVARAVAARPLVFGPDDPDPDALARLQAYRQSAAPVLVDGRPVGVHRLADLGEPPDLPSTAVAMVGGRGERLRPLTDKLPKPLLRVGGMSILQRLLGQLAGAGVTDAYLTVNYMADRFRAEFGSATDGGPRVHLVDEPAPLGTAGALCLLPTDLPAGPLFVVNGDIVTTVSFTALAEFHWHHGSLVTVAGVEYRTNVPYGVLHRAEHHLLGIEEKPDRSDFVSAGIYVLDPAALRFVPRDRPYGMPELIADVLAEGLSVHAFPILENWYDIGSPEEFEQVLLRFATGEHD
jgi:dTDP-glucose pyrophosphorylase